MAIPGAHGIAMPRSMRELCSDIDRSLRPGSCRDAFTHENYSVNGIERPASHGAHFFRHPIIIHPNPSDMSQGTGSDRRSRKGRLKVCHDLDHFGDLDLRYCKRLVGAEQSQSRIFALLKHLGAPPVWYIISSNSEIDGMELNLNEALDGVVGRGCGSFVCCIPGELAYFEGESQGERYLCNRKGAREGLKNVL